EIRLMHDADLAGVVALYNRVLTESTAVFSETPVDADERRAWWQARTARGYPVLVAADETGVTGFASFDDFRSWPGYRFTVEHTVHVRADRRAQGVGTGLMQELFACARRAGKHVMVGGVDAANHRSIAFHERLGFKRSGELPEVGYKFGRFLDLVFLCKTLEQDG